MTERLGAEHYGAERLETAAAKAERIIAEELKRRKWGEKDFAKGGFEEGGDCGAGAGGDGGDGGVAGGTVADGHGGYVNNRLYRWRKGMLRK